MDEAKKNNNYYNSWEHVGEQRGKILSEDYPVLNGLEDTWDVIDSLGLSIPRSEANDISDTPLGALTYYLEDGCYPPPEILLAVLNCFEHYMNKGGALELEDVFFNDKKNRIRNHAHFVAKQSAYESFSFLVDMSRFRKEGKSLEALATGMFNQSELYETDVESFLRGYRRWKKKEGKARA